MNEQEELNGRLEQAAKLGAVAALAQALKDGADARSGDSSALSLAAARGHVECVRLLIPVSDPLAKKSQALVDAAINGHTECVRLLIPVSDLASDSDALPWAANEGHIECVRLLLPVSDPLAGYSLALRFAAQEGHAECVRVLLPVSEPTARRVNGPLTACVRLLSPGRAPLAPADLGLSAAASARENGHMDVAGMIEAFIESQTLSESPQNSERSPRFKAAL